MKPIEIFTQWFDEELKLSKARIPTAVCLSTIGIDNYPNARFVSYKELIDNSGKWLIFSYKFKIDFLI